MIRTASTTATPIRTPRKEIPVAEEMTVAAQQLRDFVERIERLQEERKTIADDIAEVFKELEGTGFDKAATKAILKIRQADDGIAVWSERSATVDLYLTALGMAPAPARAHVHVREGERDVFDEIKGRVFPDETAVKVYFLAADELGLIKIGSSGNVEERVAALCRNGPALVSRIGVIGGGPKLELELHQRFAEHRVRGEWFSNVIRPEIDALCAPTNIEQFPTRAA